MTHDNLQTTCPPVLALLCPFLSVCLSVFLFVFILTAGLLQSEIQLSLDSYLFTYVLFLFTCAHAHQCVCTLTYIGVPAEVRREDWILWSHPMWVLRTELWSSPRVVCALNH